MRRSMPLSCLSVKYEATASSPLAELSIFVLVRVPLCVQFSFILLFNPRQKNVTVCSCTTNSL